jgi:prepilin-type N-terminal cleavage/methylation domain-containing protein
VINKIKNRMASEQGFTLIELLVVIVILGILAAIAVPSYLSFRGQAQSTANEANVRSAIPAAESYYQDPAGGNNSYDNLSAATLAQEAPGVSPKVKAAVLGTNNEAYCLQTSDDGTDAGADPYYYIGGDTSGPGVSLATGAAVSTITPGLCKDEDGGVDVG